MIGGEGGAHGVGGVPAHWYMGSATIGVWGGAPEALQFWCLGIKNLIAG